MLLFFFCIFYNVLGGRKVVAVAAAEPTSEVAEVAKKGFYTGVSFKAIDLMSHLRCHKSILGRSGFDSIQAQLFTKIDTANDWVSVRRRVAKEWSGSSFGLSAVVCLFFFCSLFWRRRLEEDEGVCKLSEL